MTNLLTMLTTRHQAALICHQCAHRCTLPPGAVGRCGAVAHQDGHLRSRIAGQPLVVHADPIERKPLYHVAPGRVVLSLGLRGCNMTCQFCQNWRITQQAPAAAPTATHPPAAVVAAAQAQGCAGVAFTYNEPTIALDYVADTLRLAHAAGLTTVCKSNGYLTPAASAALVGWLDAINIDLKSFNDAFYRRVCGARLQPVCETIAALHRHGIWLEVTTLLIPGCNDSAAELSALTAFLAQISVDIPWHVWRFHPDYRMRNHPWTHAREVERACAIGQAAGLRYVYASNLPGDPRQHTHCPGCGTLLIARHGNTVTANHLRGAACPTCDRPIPGRFLTAAEGL